MGWIQRERRAHSVFPFFPKEVIEIKIGIIDADLLCRPRHRFPNLACMKLAGYYKENNHQVELVEGYEDIGGYDHLYLSKVFTDTYVPEEILQRKDLTYGGTGFYYDKASGLPKEIEHCMPDYGLYDVYIQKKEAGLRSNSEYKFYKDYSIGFLTRGCFRQCAFCVNRNSRGAFPASPLEEFMDKKRKKLCFLDDNFFACERWERILDKVLEADKRFQFRQGIDIRILLKKQMQMLFSGKLDDKVFFAFDDIRDKELIIRKLELLYETVKVNKNAVRFYVLCGFDKAGVWKHDFWYQDIRDTFERIRVLMRFQCLPYIMRYQKCGDSPYRGMYIVISRWCNQPAQFIKKSLREFCSLQGGSSIRYLEEFEKEYPQISDYLDMKYGEVAANGTLYRG